MRLIDADLYRAALEKTLGEMEKAGDSQTDIADGVRRALRLLDMQPDDDVAPVVHGEWIATTKHKWKTKDNGEVDEFAWDREFHNGPVCTICGFTPCVHCRPDWEDDEGCKEHYVCSVCGAHEEKKYPYCHCGAKMDDSLSRTADNVVQKGETKTMDFYNMIRALDEKSRKIGLTKKERLEKLIYEGLYAMQGAVVIGLNGGYGMLADYLMSEGVIVPPSIKRGGQ